MSFGFVIIAVGIMNIIVGCMVKQQKWLSFHLSGILNKYVKVDIPQYAKFVYKIDWIFGFSFICIGSLSTMFDTELRIPAIIVLIVTVVLESYAKIKFKIK